MALKIVNSWLNMLYYIYGNRELHFPLQMSREHCVKQNPLVQLKHLLKSHI